MKVAVVGATGLVGTKMLQVLAERNFPVTELLPVASEKSVGKEVEFKGKKYRVISATDAIAAKPDVALFSAGGSTSLEWAPKFAAARITVIDNSSAWRMDATKKLVVPEINADALTKEDKIIAKIVAESLEAADFQEASGQLQAIDGQAGTLTLQENMRNGTQEQSNLSYFLFDPNNVVVLLSPSIQPVALVLKPGDEVKIQFIIKDGKQQAYSITLYSPQHTTTTTVTTTTNSQ